MHDPPRFHCKTKANNFKKAVLSYTELMVVPPKTIQPVMKSITPKNPPTQRLDGKTQRQANIYILFLVSSHSMPRKTQ